MLQATNKEQSIRIQSSGGLSEEQIQQMVRDSEAHAEQDKKRKQAIEAKNEAETAVYSAEKSVGEWKDKARSALPALISGAALRLNGHFCLAKQFLNHPGWAKGPISAAVVPRCHLRWWMKSTPPLPTCGAPWSLLKLRSCAPRLTLCRSRW